MMYTNLTYTEIGNFVGTGLLVFFTVIVVVRYILAFRNYIYTGELGDYERCFIYQLVEEKTINKYMFTGHHPGFILIDVFCFFLISVASVGLWGAYIVVGLIFLLAQTMRKRIAHKQTFVGNLKGDQLEE